ncbi:MAG: hypothetical protein J7497_10510 [Chitinophagaceae bacterium]|nr:hypothetical protein [Chitinophagaceae bacterium]
MAGLKTGFLSRNSIINLYCLPLLLLMPFETNVFINCPFDKEYVPILRAVLFTTIYFDLDPQISQNISSSDVRINQIKSLIKNSRWSIHDLSRSRAMKKGDLPRFNMPYELGLDEGCHTFGGRKYRNKKTLILASERYGYQKVLSDIAGQDIEMHENNPQTAIAKVRDWLSANDGNKILATPSKIWLDFNQFNNDLIVTLANSHSRKEIEEMPVCDYIKHAKGWIGKLKHPIYLNK